MAKRQALGRGLSALLDNAQTLETTVSVPQPEEPTIGHAAGHIAMLGISQIEANPFQPRTHFNEEQLSELSESIATHGIIQPITVRKIAVSQYQLISGERRFRACQLAGIDEVPAYVRTADDQAMLEMALVENIQRVDLDPIEVAISYKRLIEECSLTQEQLSDKVGKKRSTITNYIRLLKLPAEIQVALIEKKLTMGHARALVNVDDSQFQLNLFEQIIKHDLSVRKVEQLVRSGEISTPAKTSARQPLSLEDQKVQADLRLRFGHEVRLQRAENGTGKIEIRFGDAEDLDRILELMQL